MSYQLSEINRMAACAPETFLAEADAAFQEKICAAADKIANNLRQSPIVLLSGPSGSGKTTSALKLDQELTRRGIRTHTTSVPSLRSTLHGHPMGYMTWSPHCAWTWTCSTSTLTP